MQLLKELFALTEGKTKKTPPVKKASEFTAGKAVMARMGLEKKQAGSIDPKTAFSRNKDKREVRRELDAA